MASETRLTPNNYESRSANIFKIRTFFSRTNAKKYKKAKNLQRQFLAPARNCSFCKFLSVNIGFCFRYHLPKNYTLAKNTNLTTGAFLVIIRRTRTNF